MILIIKIARVFSVLFLTLVLLFGALFAVTTISSSDKYGIKLSLWFSEYKYEYSSGGFGDFTDYCEYHFNKKRIQKFKNNERYQLVTNDNIQDIRGYFDDFEKWVVQCDYADRYSFNKDTQINIGDYFYIYTLEGDPIAQSQYRKYDNYDVYYVDIESCTVYFIHSNI